MNGRIVVVYGNLVIAATNGEVVQNSIGYCLRSDGARLLCEIIRVRGQLADLQVFEETRGLKVGDEVEFQDKMLSVVLGPGLLGQIYDGLQNPLPQLAEQVGYFLEPGKYIHGLPTDTLWQFTPTSQVGQTVTAGQTLGTVPEGEFTHCIMAPFTLQGKWTVEKIAEPGEYTIENEIAVLVNAAGQNQTVSMQQSWPTAVLCPQSRW